jgi:hypothetical protein
MRIRRSAILVVLWVCLGCQSTDQQSRYPQSRHSGPSAELCNTPGRKAMADQIVARGGRLLDGEDDWDNSVDAATKEKMGHPLSGVVLPQDKFSAKDVATAQLLFPEAQISTPLTLDEVEADGSDTSDD